MGTLYLCPTPIGNLDDITYRTIKVLNEVDIIYAEDTRRSLKLLNHLKITKNLSSYHEHNKFKKLDEIVSNLLDGKDVALVSDAGTPAISDPGFELVCKCVDLGIRVCPLPGACACITALIASGMDTRRFVFEGFLPKNNKEKQEILDKNKNETRTMIFYESPHRLKSTLENFKNNFGNRKICICKELTKIYESFNYTSIEDAIEYYSDKNIKGEYVIVLEGMDDRVYKERTIEEYTLLNINDHMNIYLEKGYNDKEAMKKVAKDRGMTKREIYSIIKGGNDE